MMRAAPFDERGWRYVAGADDFAEYRPSSARYRAAAEPGGKQYDILSCVHFMPRAGDAGHGEPMPPSHATMRFAAASRSLSPPAYAQLPASTPAAYRVGHAELTHMGDMRARPRRRHIVGAPDA